MRIVIKPNDYMKDGEYYCGQCHTKKTKYLGGVLGHLPKACKCYCERNGIEWTPDEANHEN